MKIYFAGYSVDKNLYKTTEASCLLESYLYFKKRDYKKWHEERKLLDRDLFLDSGAFSAFTLGKKINIDEYINFIKKNKKNINVYATLDVIGDYKATNKNTEYMESKGLNPLPTFHFGSPLEELERLCNKYEYIALGGLVPLSMQRKKLENWLNKCFKVIVNRKKITKVHGFGVNSFWAWEKYPFYSVDATSWVMGGKFRRVIKFKGGKFIAYNKKSKETSIEKLKAFQDHYSSLNLTNLKEYRKGADHITKLWEKRGIKW